MNLISLIIGFVIILESIIVIYFLINSNIKVNNKTFLIASELIMIIAFIISLNEIKINILSYKELMLLFVIIESAEILYLMYNYNDLQNKYNKIINYIVEYEKIIDDQGKKNHEYNNQLLVLKGYIGNKKKLEEYLDTIVDEHRTGQNFEIRQLSHFPNGGIKELLYCKLARMKENDIKFFVYVSEEVSKYFEEFNIKMYKDITKLFGVFIDNAIEGAIESEKKEIELDFKKDDNYLIVTITNTFKEGKDLTKVGEKGYTTKGVGHGYGLSIVRDIIKSNRKLEVCTEVQNERYRQSILIEL